MFVRFRSFILSLSLIIVVVILNMPTTGEAIGERLVSSFLLTSSPWVLPVFSTLLLLSALLLLVASLKKYHGRVVIITLIFLAFVPPLISYLFY
ncbi:hypothetical protein [Alkalihalobacillus pseudalcaliphilus]|uniref:hypothetical protein n=1 Tax=Alkalihalobacillus pseudalcaliphilus TaxID=79884 RepID=UPI0023629091|nr:hypothetical protein [Alkalihalobacillus pseudalcaliphilus]